MPDDPVNGAIAFLIFLLFVYIAAHTWIVRPIIHAIERTVGRRFFPFLDRVLPR